MDRNIYIGDKVRTNQGDGFVEDARTWRDVIVEMNDYEAAEFSNRCKVEVGLNFKEDWVEVAVRVKGRVRRFLSKDIQILQGRDLDVED